LSSNLVITGGLVHSHPFLAEYDKYVIVELGDSNTIHRAGYDAGGDGSICLYQDNDSIIVAHGYKGRVTLLKISSKNGRVRSHVVREVLQEEFEYLGRFDFVQRGQYGFIPATAGEFQRPGS
jgi:hypothetical protein